MDEDIVLHQTPDLPYGGEYTGRNGVAECFAKMSSLYSYIDVQDPVFVENGDVVIVTCTLKTTSRATKEILSQPMVQVVTVKNGKITDFRPYYWNVPSYVASCQTKLGIQAGIKRKRDATCSHRLNQIGDLIDLVSEFDV